MNPFQQQAPIKGIKRIIAVASGKGGVGKSTISFNLAKALKNESLQVGLLDLDIYGPSLPRLSGTESYRASLGNNEKVMVPQKHGLHLMSMGYFVDEDTPAIWRGPMLVKAIEQLLKDCDWPELDVLVVDLPPGTGDVPLTLAQKVPLFGSLVVCTPQSLALSDMIKAIEMFNQVNVPILGIVKNMSEFKTPNGQMVKLFPSGDFEGLTKKYKLEILESIEFLPQVAFCSEKGVPFSQEDQNNDNNPFINLAIKIKEKLNLNL